ncbi:MAG: DedA family protein [Sphingomonadaceae bacterium]|nr:DedA family protein [Sphingomonadaceae bacterium]
MSLTSHLSAVAAWIVGVIAAGGYWGVMLLMAIESACIPLPSEIIMPFAGYLVSQGRLELFWVATAGALGCNLGSIVGYELARFGGRPLVERYGRYVLLSAHDLDRAETFFARFGGLAVLICRLLPVVRTFIAVPAGLARMNLVRFHAYTFIGSWPFCYALAYAGMRLGAAWDSDPRVKALFHRLDLAIVLLGVIFVIWFAVHKLRKARPR